METSPSGIPGRHDDALRWELLTQSAGTAVLTPAGTVAEAHVSERDDEVVVEFWTGATGLPDELRAQLVGQAFSHPAVTAGRPIVVCVPRGDSEVLALARRRVQGSRIHVAGVTCLIEGHVPDGRLPAPGSASRSHGAKVPVQRRQPR
jgi:hypothetical protein